MFGLEKKLSFEVMNFPKEAPEGKYDFVICSEIIEHIPNDLLALERIRALLKKGGRVLVTTPSESSFWNRLGLTKKHDEFAGHVRRYSLKSIHKLFTKVGFKVVHKSEKDGPVKEALFMFPVFGIIVRVANKFGAISEALVVIDEFLSRLLGSASLYVVGEKK